MSVSGLASPGATPSDLGRRKDGAKTPSRMIKHRVQSQMFAFSQQCFQGIIYHLTLSFQMNCSCGHVCLFCQQRKAKCSHKEILIAYIFTKGALCMWFTTCLNTVFLHQPFIKNNRLQKSFFEHCRSILIITEIRQLCI